MSEHDHHASLQEGRLRPTLATAVTPKADHDVPPPPEPNLQKPAESYKSIEESSLFEKPAFLPPKPIPHSPKISPSSIPNPNPSVTTTKQVESGYPNYGGYLYSVPGYSAFQPVSYPGMVQPNHAPVQSEPTHSEFVTFPDMQTKEPNVEENNEKEAVEIQPKDDTSKSQTDFEEHFTPEIIPAVSTPDANKGQNTESKMSIASLTQSSGSTNNVPTQIPNKDIKKKPAERFSLKTSIPISKIDMKCVSNPPDTQFQNAISKKVIPFNPTVQKETGPRVEIQSNIVIKTAQTEPEPKPETKQIPYIPNNSISTLINAAEAINKTENQFRMPEPKQDILHEDSFETLQSNRPIFTSINTENKINFSNKPPDGPSQPPYNEQQKNQILLIQNKNPSNQKMLVAIQQQNPQVLLQRTNFDSKNLQAPSRLSNQKKSKEDIVNDSLLSSKVVALKRLHQENCDENDFENLITENQIYGNKIVVKEKSQGTLQEQDLNNKNKGTDKQIQPETKNVVLQPNFLYLSNVQFPANLMMIKNNSKVNQTSDCNKTKGNYNENKTVTEASIMNNNSESNTTTKNPKTQNIAVTKEIHVLKSSNNVLQTLSNKNNKSDLVIQTNQKVLMNPQIVYQVPMIVDTDSKLNQPFINKDYQTFLGHNNEYPKQLETKPNDKLYIACPYQMDSKLQPKIVITNIRPKINIIEEISSLDIYEKRKRMRRLKYLSNVKEIPKSDFKKPQNKTNVYNSIITPDNIKSEIFKEFSNTKLKISDETNESGSDFDEEELQEYNSIIKEFGDSTGEDSGKIEFLATLRLATRDVFKEKELELQERTLKLDSVAAAYVAAGRLDRLANENLPKPIASTPPSITEKEPNCEHIQKENEIVLRKKKLFLSQLKLKQVTQQYKEGYERTWQEIIKERKRRNGVTDTEEKVKQPKHTDLGFDPNGHLQMLKEIKKSVNDNNNLIKKRLDSNCDTENSNENSIRVLAERNFSELNRLSNMADRSVKLFSGQDTRKRDLNPGFDSENIKKPVLRLDQPFQNYPTINIPNISKLITLKSTHETPAVTTTQAISMDEPQNYAAGVKEMVQNNTTFDRVQDFSCQVDKGSLWPGVDSILKSYREFEIARKKEISDLHRRNTGLRVESAYVTRAASRDSDRARALLAERQNLAVEENNLRLSIQRLCAAIDVIRNC